MKRYSNKKLKHLANFNLGSKYKVCRSLGYPILGEIAPIIDTETIYLIKAFAKAFENRPIIERVDGKFYKGNRLWIVDYHNLEKL